MMNIHNTTPNKTMWGTPDNDDYTQHNPEQNNVRYAW